MDIFSPSPHARMKIVRYPCVAHGSHIDGDASSGEPTNGEMGVGAHADGGGLTVRPRSAARMSSFTHSLTYGRAERGLYIW